MNETRITNIIDAGGVDGWDHGNLEVLKKTFEFESFERANDFIQEVGKFCETKDHHPQWSTSNGGKTVHVELTSHFANNTVTIFDFEVAQAMNNIFWEVRRNWMVNYVRKTIGL